MTQDQQGKIRQQLDDMLEMADKDDRIGYLEYDIRAMEQYIYRQTKRTLEIKKLQSSVSRFYPPTLRDDSAVIYYPPGQNHFENRVHIAIGLGLIVGTYLADSPIIDDIGIALDTNRLIYFAIKLLQERTDLLQTSACFRDEYALSSSDVRTKVCKLFKYDESKISSATQQGITKLLEEIHNIMPDNGLLDHDMHLASLHAKKVNADKDVLIARRPSNTLKSNKCTTHCYEDKFSICYSKENNPLEQRVLVGHELGNIVSHWEPGRDGIFDETTEEREEATYFAKILLERRAKLYLNGEENPHYKKSCQTILQTIKKMYFGQSWLNSL